MEFKSVVEYMKHYLVLLCFVNYKIRKKLSAYGSMIPTYIFIHELYAWNNIWSDVKKSALEIAPSACLGENFSEPSRNGPRPLFII